MKKSLPFAVAAILGSATSSHAANYAVITTPPAMLNILILLLACAAAAVCARVLAAVKGGYMAKSWLLFAAAFCLVAVGQVAFLLQTVEIITLPIWATPAIAVVWAGIFFYGAFEAKRTLG